MPTIEPIRRPFPAGTYTIADLELALAKHNVALDAISTIVLVDAVELPVLEDAVQLVLQRLTPKVAA